MWAEKLPRSTMGLPVMGWFWHRWNAGASARPRYVDALGRTFGMHHEDVEADELPGEWWPIPIAPPAPDAGEGEA